MEYKLTEAQRTTLQPYERHLHTALHASYVVGLDSRTLKTLFTVYNETFNAHERNTHCNYCVMQVCIGLAKLYYAPSDEPAAPAPKKSRKTKK